MATTKAFELAQLSAGVTSTTGVASLTDALDINGAEILVGTNNSRFAENNLRFMATGASYIDVNTVGQALNFRVSDTSSLDTTPLIIASDGKVTLPNLTGQVAIDTGSLTLDGGYNVQWGGSYSAGFPTIWGHSTNKQIKFAPDGTTSGLLYQMSATQLDVNPTTTSTTSTSGALVVAGGAGIAENLNVGGDLTVTGDFTVEGSQVTLNTTALDVEDKNITLNYHASNDTSASADGAGITIQDAVDASNDASILWNATGDRFDFSHAVEILGNLDLAASTTETRSLQIGNGRTGDGISLIDLVGDTTYSDYGFRFQRAGGANGKSSLLHHGTGNLEIRALEAASIRFKTTDADRMRINADGNIYFYDSAADVGMVWDASEGTDGALLIGGHTDLRAGSVAGRNDAQLSLESTNFHNAIFVANQNTANGYHLIIGKSRGTDVNDVDIVQALDEIGSLVFAAADGTDIRPKVSQISSYVSAGTTPGVNTVSGELRFGTTNQAQDVTNHMVLDKDGKVGIGTLTPEAVLDVRVDSNLAYTSTMSGVSSYTPSASDIIQVRNAETGVNDIYAGIWFETGTGATNTTGTDRAGRIALVVDNDNAYSSNFVFQTRGSAGTLTEKMRITQDGKVGIGTNAPNAPLHVKTTSTVSTDETVIIEAPIYPNLRFNSTNTNTNNRNWNFSSVYNSYGTFEILSSTAQNGVASTTRLSIKGTDGNVGIGTSAPAHRLDVTGGTIGVDQVRHSVRPSLNLDFANSKELDSRITFYRDSIATYYDSKGVLKYANVNEPRFDHDPVTGESKGLLIEETEDNIFANTNNPEKWTLTSKNGNFGWQSNGMKSPDGTMNATKFFITGTDPYWYQNNLTLNGTYTFSYWIKAEGNAVGKQYTTRITNVSSNQTIADTLPSEWTRKSFTFTTGATSTAYIGVEAPDSSPADGDVLSIWGGQLEKLPFASSYMPSLNTFRSRSSNATYYDKDGVLKTAPRNTPRYGYTHDGNKFVETGLIKEEASTNHLTNHLAKDSANWYMTGSGFSGVNNPTHTFSQTQTAPDGSLTAVELDASNTSTPNISTAYNIGSTSSWARGSWSLFVKPFGNTDVYSMWVDNGSGTTGATVQFQISTMSYQTTHTRGGTIVEYGRIEKLADGWYRIGMVVSGTLPQFQCRCYAADGVFGVDEDGYGSATGGSTSSANGTYFWGGQVEEGTAATGATISSYIYGGGGTTRAQDIGLGTQQTRKIDVAHLDDILYADWNNEEEGTFYTEYEVPYDIEDISVNYRVLERHTEGTGQNVTSILLNAGTDQTNAGAYNNSGWQALLGVTNSLGVTDKNVVNKLAFGFKDNDFGVSIQGSPIAQDSSGTVTRGATRLQLGSNSSLANTLNGHLKIVKFYPERLSNAELVALTENN